MDCHSIGFFCVAFEDYPHKVVAPKTRQITFSQSDFLFHPDLLVLIPVSYWKSQKSSGPQDKKNYIFTGTDFLFSSGSTCFNPCIVLEKSVFSSSIIWHGLHYMFYFPKQEFHKFTCKQVPSLQIWKNELQIKKEDLHRASKSCTALFMIAKNWFVWWISMYAAGSFLNS